MGSRSTYLRAQVGGFEGRTLKLGDELPVGDSGYSAIATPNREFSSPSWYIRTLDLPASSPVVLRVLRGTHFDQMTSESRACFFSDEFQITPQSDRMGYRMTGAQVAA